jgi:DNA-binding MarR family transcriptional regulator
MHVAFFGIKRVHLRVLDVSRALLREKHLTPARFDMMRIVEAYREHGLPQWAIQHRLGVSAPTVSRMLKALEKLGFVKRKRSARDRRTLIVKITQVGIWVVENAHASLIESGIAERFALRGLALDRDEARAALPSFEHTLMRMRRNYGDSTPFDLPWRKQDVVPLVYSELIDGRWVDRVAGAA